MHRLDYHFGMCFHRYVLSIQRDAQYFKYEVKMEKLLLKPLEAAQVLGIGRSLVYELIARKEIPSVRLGRCIRVPAESLRQWLRERENCQLNESKERQGQDGE